MKEIISESINFNENYSDPKWTKAKKSLKEKYKLPEWKAYRDKIIARDGRCMFCGSRKYLTAHHRYYPFGIWDWNPWDFPEEDMLCACWTCNGLEHVKSNENTPHFNIAVKRRFTGDHIILFRRALEQMVVKYPEELLCKALCWLFSTEYKLDDLMTDYMNERFHVEHRAA